MSERRGDPQLTIRLEPHVLEKLREVAVEAKGKFGGAAHYVRLLIYADLGLGEPPSNAAHLSARSGRRRREQAAKEPARDDPKAVEPSRKPPPRLTPTGKPRICSEAYDRSRLS